MSTAFRIEWSLADAVARPGCPVCAVLRDGERRYWDGFLYEGFQDPDAELAHGPQRAFRAVLGDPGRIGGR